MTTQSHPILPPAVLGIIGGGQLGMMLVREAQRMGYRSIVWDRDPDCPAFRLADETLAAPFSDRAAARELAARAAVITYEFENIDADTVAMLEESCEVHPGSRILRISQHRELEKTELRRRGFPTVEHAIARNPDELDAAIRSIGIPVVVKTTTAGYDGKGQTVLRTPQEADDYVRNHPRRHAEYIVEEFVRLQCELSAIVVRGRDGSVTAFPVVENEHRENILHSTVAPARVSAGIQGEAVSLASSIIAGFDIVGILCIEMFLTMDGRLLVNEIAPRPHNSGHYTLDACDLSQFEALIRAACGLPLPEPRLASPCAMVNLLGKHVTRLDVPSLLSLPGVRLHLYGKTRVEPKRKMGHVTIVAGTPEEVDALRARVETMIGEPSRVQTE